MKLTIVCTLTLKEYCVTKPTSPLFMFTAARRQAFPCTKSNSSLWIKNSGPHMHSWFMKRIGRCKCKPRRGRRIMYECTQALSVECKFLILACACAIPVCVCVCVLVLWEFQRKLGGSLGRYHSLFVIGPYLFPQSFWCNRGQTTRISKAALIPGTRKK